MSLDQSILDKYEPVIGLEVHAQMLTNTKAYSNDVNEYGAQPNTNISAITLGHPGTLPKMNERTIQYAIKLGLALGCDIAPDQHFARKNYFYPDLPKGYQITQDTTPICTGGNVIIKQEDGTEKTIAITRIHMEEDAGKSIHDVDVIDTLVDLNRAGTPLLEIVTEPELRSSQEAYSYLTEVRKLLRYLEICDGNMEEGSMRCDANVSVRLKGASEFGVKVEVKNMNSIRNVQRAIEFEIVRQITAIEAGVQLFQESRAYDALKNVTIGMRSKEAANDYRYFPEPDLQPIHVGKEQISAIHEQMPALPRDLYLKYTNEFKLSEYDATILIDSKAICLYYEEIIKHTKNYKQAANWLMGDVKSYINQRAIEISEFPLSADKIARLVEIIAEGKISNNVASQQVFPAMLLEPTKDPLEIATALNVITADNSDEIIAIIAQILIENPSETLRYKAGEKQLTGFFMGKLMKASNGKADPKTANKLMISALEKN
jgi:aspartyl-tRNA(Asn)/glutamyl-tRNA(Gln) amidotransferase subunit B